MRCTPGGHSSRLWRKRRDHALQAVNVVVYDLIAGEIPPELGLLGELQEVRLNNNRLCGESC